MLLIRNKYATVSVITRKENASKECNSCIIAMVLTSFNVYFLCLVMLILCVYAVKLLSGFFGTR